MKTFYLSMCMSLVMLAGFAQKSIIKGNITDDSNLPLPGAIVTIEELDTETISNFNGEFVFLGLEGGDCKITASYLGYKSLTQKVQLQKGVNTVTNFVLEVSVNSLNEVVLKGSNASGQAKALNKQKNNMNITNVVAADQVGKFPDANIGDAVKRIPGIAVQNDQGEARNIIVRGLAPQLNSVTLNGERIPSAEGDNRNVQLDLIPSDMVQAVEVNKVVTPDMEADAIGGSVNLVTRGATKARITATGSLGMNHIRNKPIVNFSTVLADRFFDDKLGAILSSSIQSTTFGSDNIEFEWGGSATNPTITEHDIRRYDLTRQRESAALNLDYKFNEGNTIFFNAIYNTRKDWENRYRLRFKDIEETAPGVYETEVRRQTKGGLNKDARLEEQQIQKYALKGEHILFNSVKFNWKGNYSSASEKRPKERYISYRQKDVLVGQNLSDLKFPEIVPNNNDYNDFSKFDLKEATEENQYTKEENYGFKANFKIPMLKGTFKNVLKVGYRYKEKEKVRDNDFTEYEPTSNLDITGQVSNKTLSDFKAGSQYKSGNFIKEEYLTSLNFSNASLFDKTSVLEEFVPSNYNANEKVNAFYGMITQNIGKKIAVILGARIEKTDINYSGFRIDIETANSIADATKLTADKSYTNILPNIQFKGNLTDNTIVRLAYSNTIARPNYFDLVPYQNINSDDFEFAEGNPDLEATTSKNFDLMFEQYFSSVGLFSVGGFYKKLDDFIFNYAETGYTDTAFPGETFDYSQPRNGKEATIYGLEVALQTKLNFVADFLKDFNLYANYTYTHSDADGVDGRNNLDLAGAVDHMLNGSIAYETKKLTARVSLNYADDYVDEYGSNAFEDRYYDNQLFLDVNASYEIAKGFRLFSEFKNLTNQALRYFQGRKDLTMQAEYYSFNWNVGLKYNF